LLPLPEMTQAQINCDSELHFLWQENGKSKRMRQPVATSDPSIRTLLQTLVTRRPDASLMDLEPNAAMKRLGVLSSTHQGAIVGVALIGTILAGASFMASATISRGMIVATGIAAVTALAGWCIAKFMTI